MHVVTMESEAYNKLMQDISKIKEFIEDKKNEVSFKERWFDNQEVCEMLHISKRTLQSYRDNKQIPYSQVNGKIYYKGADIDQWLEMNKFTPSTFQKKSA